MTEIINPHLSSSSHDDLIGRVVYLVTMQKFSSSDAGGELILNPDDTSHRICLTPKKAESAMLDYFVDAYCTEYNPGKDLLSYGFVNDHIYDFANGDHDLIELNERDLRNLNTAESANWLVSRFTSNDLCYEFLGKLLKGTHQITMLELPLE